MKKLLLMAFATISLVACVQEEVVNVPQTDAITFDQAYIDNATRTAADPSTTTASIDAFDVWAFMNEWDGTVLTDEDVTRTSTGWTYANTQYWTPLNKYYFAALAPMNSANVKETLATSNETAKLGLGEVEFTNVDGSEDLLYAATMVQAPRYEDLKLNNMPPVNFKFSHLLSKVKFTFTNGFKTNNAYVVIEDIVMTAPKTGTIDLAVENWWDNDDWQLGTETVDLEFGDVAKLAMGSNDECAKERLTIPAEANQVYEITFTVKLYMGQQLALEDVKTSTVTGVAFEMGKAYNLTAEINPDNLELPAIEFDVEVKEWELPYVDHEVGAYKDVTGTKYLVATADGLAQVAEEINAGEFTGNVELVGDIDLANFTLTKSSAVVSNWAPIGTPEQPFTGSFDGNGFTIKNLALVESEAKEGKAYIGFFGYAKNATIKNVTFENVYINIPCLDIDHSQGHIGAVAGSLEGTSTIENVTVKGDIQVYATQTANGASRVAVVAGGNAYGDVTMKNVHVIANDGSSLIANNNTGALAGQLQGKMYFENCTSNIDVTVNKFFAGGLVGIAAGDSKFVNCHTTGDVAVVAGREGRHNDEYRVGGIAGGWADDKTKVCTLENCSYTGNVSGVNTDGSVADPLDYMGYVGRGYTLSNCAGSKVVIDGTEFVQKYDNVYGVYTINGCTPVATAEELVAALAAGEGVYFMNDITVAATKGGYNKAGILQNKAQTIDGAGHTLKVTGAGATWDCAIYTNGGIIRNLTVAGAMRGIFTAGQSSDLHIENVEFKNVIYTFNSDGKDLNPKFGVYVTNSTVNGWTSHSNMHTEVVYTNCSFGEGSGYKYCRPYGTTKFVNCTFCAGYTVDKSQTSNITFTDCIWE